MSTTNYNGYHQLMPEERGQIEALLKKGESISQIARDIGRHKSTISREIRRNSIASTNKHSRVNHSKLSKLDARHFRGSTKAEDIIEAKKRYNERVQTFNANKTRYLAHSAGKKAALRRAKATHHGLLLDRPSYAALKKDLLKRLEEDRWTPEEYVLHNRAMRQRAMTDLPDISHTTIYAYIAQHPELKIHLVHKGKRYRYYKTNNTVYNQTNRSKHRIQDRPKIVEARTRPGDLEGDTIVGKDQRDRIITHYDRVLKKCSLSLQLGYSSYKVVEQSVEDLRRVFTEVHTITYDNGSEFSNWRELEKELGATVYFADPYSPWQRGGNEHLNGIVRRFFPKGTDFKTLTNSDIMRVESLINNRPLKCLGGLTPLEYEEMLHLGA